jgi:hypothetical protein
MFSPVPQDEQTAESHDQPRQETRRFRDCGSLKSYACSVGIKVGIVWIKDRWVANSRFDERFIRIWTSVAGTSAGARFRLNVNGRGTAFLESKTENVRRGFLCARKMASCRGQIDNRPPHAHLSECPPGNGKPLSDCLLQD